LSRELRPQTSSAAAALHCICLGNKAARAAGIDEG
jgi:hypothetical protein